MQSLLTLSRGTDYQVIIDHQAIWLLSLLLALLVQAMQKHGHSLCHNHSITRWVLIDEAVSLSLLCIRDSNPTWLVCWLEILHKNLRGLPELLLWWNYLLYFLMGKLEALWVLDHLARPLFDANRACVAYSSLVCPRLTGHLYLFSVRAYVAMRAMAHHAFVAAPLQLFYRFLAARALQALMISHSKVT